MQDPQQLNLYAYTRNNPLKYIDPTGMWIDTSQLSGEDYRKWRKIVELANQKDDKGNYVNKDLHTAYTLIDRDDRAFVLQNTPMEGAVGKFDIMEFSGDKDFSKASIQIDFRGAERINSVTPANFVPGFNKFEGILNNRTAKLAEAFGHEFGHAIYAIFNAAEEVSFRMLATEIKADTARVRAPYPPDVIEKIERNLKYYVKTEQYSQQVEQLINGNLRAQD